MKKSEIEKVHGLVLSAWNVDLNRKVPELNAARRSLQEATQILEAMLGSWQDAPVPPVPVADHPKARTVRKPTPAAATEDDDAL